jgi:hypothetical protein
MSLLPRYLDEYTPNWDHLAYVLEDFYQYLDPEEEVERPTDEEYREAVQETLAEIDEKLQSHVIRHSIINNIEIKEEDDDVLWGIWVEEIEAWNTNQAEKTIEIGDGSGLLPRRELNYCNHQGREYQPYNRT